MDLDDVMTLGIARKLQERKQDLLNKIIDLELAINKPGGNIKFNRNRLIDARQELTMIKGRLGEF